LTTEPECLWESEDRMVIDRISFFCIYSRESLGFNPYGKEGLVARLWSPLSMSEPTLCLCIASYQSSP